MRTQSLHEKERVGSKAINNRVGGRKGDQRWRDGVESDLSPKTINFEHITLILLPRDGPAADYLLRCTLGTHCIVALLTLDCCDHENGRVVYQTYNHRRFRTYGCSSGYCAPNSRLRIIDTGITVFLDSRQYFTRGHINYNCFT